MEERYNRFYNSKGKLKAAWIKVENVMFVGDTDDEAVALIHLNDGTKMEIYTSDLDGFSKTVGTHAEGWIEDFDRSSIKKEGYFGVCGYNILKP